MQEKGGGVRTRRLGGIQGEEEVGPRIPGVLEGGLQQRRFRAGHMRPYRVGQMRLEFRLEVELQL